MSGLLQVLDFGQQQGRVIFKLGTLRVEILFGILAGAEFEVQVAEVLIELILSLKKKVQSGFLALAGKHVLRPEGVDQQRQSQEQAGQFALQSGHRSKS